MGVQGRKWAEFNSTLKPGSHLDIDISQLPEGVFLLVVIHPETGAVWSQRVLKINGVR